MYTLCLQTCFEEDCAELEQKCIYVKKIGKSLSGNLAENAGTEMTRSTHHIHLL